MRIGFIGKGGSGKTSISSAFARYLAKNQKVLFIDADVNSHAHECFHMSPSSPLGERSLEVSRYFHGLRKDISSDQMIGSTPPAKGSILIKDIHDNQFIRSLSNIKDNISLLSVGSYTHNDCGVNCYHSKLIPVEIILHHTLDKDSDIIIMDATAGIDILGTSLYVAFDTFFFMIEPTKKSISVFKEFTSKLNVRVIPVLNKVKTKEDIEFVKSQGIDVKIVIPESELLRYFEQGDKLAIDKFIEENTSIFDEIINISKKELRNKQLYYQNLINIYKKSCETWYNNYFKTNLFEKTSIDKEFLKSLSEE